MVDNTDDSIIDGNTENLNELKSMQVQRDASCINIIAYIHFVMIAERFSKVVSRFTSNIV